jgi:hypothetical protein
MSKILSTSFKLLPLACFIGLSACGGGGGGGSDTPKVPPVYSFSLTSTLTNKCGEELPFTDFEVFVQNEDWSIIEKIVPDVNGMVSLTTENELINYTVAAKSQQGDEVEGYQFTSFYQVNTTTAAIYQAQYQERVNSDDDPANANCECITQDVEARHTPLTNIDNVSSSATFETNEFVDSQHTTFTNVEACRVIDGEWPIHSFSVVGTSNNNLRQGAAEFISDFSASVMNDLNKPVWELLAFDPIETIALNKNHQAFTTKQLFQDREHFKIDVLESDDTLDLFNGHIYISESFYSSMAEFIFDESSSAFGTMKISSRHQVISTDHASSFLVEATEKYPEIDTVNFSEIKADWSYDYSDVADYPMAVISVDYFSIDPTSNTPIPAQWKTYGPISGQLPVTTLLSGYEGIINEETIVLGTTSDLIKSAQSNNYESYLEFYQNGSNTTFAENVKSYHIEIEN